MSDLEGVWDGQISGTNTGHVIIRISASGDALDGTIDVSDQEFGPTRFIFVGSRQDHKIHLRITPHEWPEDVSTAPGTVIGKIQSDGTLAGIWETDLGTAGTFSAKRSIEMMKPKRMGEETVRDGTSRSFMTPLWVIAAFVSLSEAIAGLAVIQAQGTVQAVLTGFVVLFPILVASAFFFILWTKPYVFYPPTEFGKETKVTEYVQAISGFSPVQAEAKQRQLMSDQPERRGVPKIKNKIDQVPPEETEKTELASNILKFFAFQRMRYTDVSDAMSRAVFNLGAFYGFNLFDGIPGIAFFGYFHNLKQQEIIANVRFLLNNMDLAFHRVKELKDNSQRDTALGILNQIYVEILIPENASQDNIKAKIEEYRPKGSVVRVSLHKPSEIEKFVELEYEKMGL